MSVRNYAESHPTVRISTKRFEASPFLERYATEDTVFGVYSGRLYPLSLGSDVVADYWQLRRQAALFDVPERPLLVEGPDAERLLDLMFVCDVTSLSPGRARYAIACDNNGGVLMDGVLIRHSADRFWYVMADGDFVGWIRAHAVGMDVRVEDADSWVAQIQGPASLNVLEAACEQGLPQPFGYFAVARVAMAGQEVMVTRTGWSGELGFEVYTAPGIDGGALWDHLVAVGRPLGLVVQALGSLGIRRVEAGILDNGTDMNPSMTPFAAGLGKFVNFEGADFIGRDALARPGLERRPRLLGLSCPSTTPVPGAVVTIGGTAIGRVTAGAWSPFLGVGIGYMVMDQPPKTPEIDGVVVGLGAEAVPASIVSLPFYDAERKIPRGLEVMP